jgi:hypothetical protein
LERWPACGRTENGESREDNRDAQRLSAQSQRLR